MSQTHFVAERLIDAPPAVVYHCLADYQHHHNTSGFLPPAFSELHVERGGVGEGTRFRATLRLGGRALTFTRDVTEPEPGRVLFEGGVGGHTRSVVEPRGRGALVRFETVIEAGGLEGVLSRLFAPRLLAPLYADELERLERYAQAHAAAA